MIPEIRNGKAIYLVGRATQKYQRAKYLGLPGAPKPLYGFELIRGAAKVFVVEGAFDWLTLVGWGYPAVALLLHPQVQQALHARAISFADARALAPLEAEDQVAMLEEIRASPKPLSSRQVKARVEARRVMRLVKLANEPNAPNVPNVPKVANEPSEPKVDCYAALFEELASLVEVKTASKGS